ncbi:MAG: mechanosensitive ion channel [Rhodospirillales bacterium]|nr:mechanosensitive ion channel [Rhodospirillales bacterium]
MMVLSAGASGGSARADESAPGVGEAKATVGEPATLRVWNRTIVTLRAQIGSLTPQTRIERIGQRIADLPLDALTGAVTAVPATVGKMSGYWIYVGGRTVLALLPEDIDPESELTLDQEAAAVAQRLRDSLLARAEQQSAALLLRAIALSAGATALFGGGLWAIAWMRRRALRRLAASAVTRPLRVRGLNLRPFFRTIEQSAIKLTALAGGLAAGYLWLTYVLLQFPYSRPWGAGLGIWLVELLRGLGSGALNALPGFFTVIVIFLATRLVAQAVDRFFRSVESGWLRVSWLEAETARATRRLAIVLIWIFALTVAYPYIPGSHSDAFKGISVLIGLMVSLGSAGFVNQVMSGLVIVYSRSLRSGEFVQVGETQGRITEIGVLATKMVTPTLQEITIPNAALAATSITNFSRLANAETGSIIGTTATIGYDTPWRQVHAMLLLAAERTPGVRTTPKPRVLQRVLSDFYVEYQLLVSLDDPEVQRVVLSDLHANIQDVFNEFGVQIMSPHFKDQPAEKVWVPKSEWFAPPAVSLDPSDSSTNAAPTRL